MDSIGIPSLLSGRQQEIQRETEEANQKIYNIVRQYPQIHWVDFMDLAPRDFAFNGISAYFDADHFNVYGAETIAQHFIASGRHLLVSPSDNQPKANQQQNKQ